MVNNMERETSYTSRMKKSLVLLLCRRYISSMLLYLIGVSSGITLYSVFTSNIILHHQTTREGDLFKPPTSEARSTLPVVFVGGHPRSGTTLMRVLLDAHPSFHCGQETHVIPDLLNLRRKYSRGRARDRLREAGIDPRVINATIADAVLNIIRNRRGALDSPHQLRLCAKDPFTLKHIPYLSLVYPSAKFILMVRDGRAVVHSIRKNNVKIAHFPKTDQEGLRRWNQAVEIMLDGCLEAGSQRCIVVHYESLVLEPRFWLRKILRFLRVPWSESVLKHTRYFGASGGIFLSRLEKSTNQVLKPIYNDSLYSWLSTPVDVPRRDLISLAPMMDILGYTEQGRPNYSKLKEKIFIFKKT